MQYFSLFNVYLENLELSLELKKVFKEFHNPSRVNLYPPHSVAQWNIWQNDKLGQ